MPLTQISHTTEDDEMRFYISMSNHSNICTKIKNNNLFVNEQGHSLTIQDALSSKQVSCKDILNNILYYGFSGSDYDEWISGLSEPLENHISTGSVTVEITQEKDINIIREILKNEITIQSNNNYLKIIKFLSILIYKIKSQITPNIFHLETYNESSVTTAKLIVFVTLMKFILNHPQFYNEQLINVIHDKYYEFFDSTPEYMTEYFDLAPLIEHYSGP